MMAVALVLVLVLALVAPLMINLPPDCHQIPCVMYTIELAWRGQTSQPARMTSGDFIVRARNHAADVFRPTTPSATPPTHDNPPTCIVLSAGLPV